MWIVRLALRRPYTFVVMSMAILLLGVAAILTMPIDIFPYIDIPVVSVIWTYDGISPDEMESRIRHHLRARHDHHGQRYRAHRVAVLQRRLRDPRVFPAQREIELAMAQITAMAQSILRGMPPGIFPPIDSEVRRLQRSDSATGPGEQDAERAGNLRPGAELHPHSAGHRAGRRRAVALRRQAAADHGGSGSGRSCTPSSSRPPMFPTPSTCRT